MWDEVLASRDSVTEPEALDRRFKDQLFRIDPVDPNVWITRCDVVQYLRPFWNHKKCYFAFSWSLFLSLDFALLRMKWNLFPSLRTQGGYDVNCILRRAFDHSCTYSGTISSYSIFGLLSVWPNLAKLCPFGKILNEVFGQMLNTDLFFDWANFNVGNSQIVNKLSVTLLVACCSNGLWLTNYLWWIVFWGIHGFVNMRWSIALLRRRRVGAIVVISKHGRPLDPRLLLLKSSTDHRMVPNPWQGTDICPFEKAT